MGATRSQVAAARTRGQSHFSFLLSLPPSSLADLSATLAGGVGPAPASPYTPPMPGRHELTWKWGGQRPCASWEGKLRQGEGWPSSSQTHGAEGIGGDTQTTKSRGHPVSSHHRGGPHSVLWGFTRPRAQPGHGIRLGESAGDTHEALPFLGVLQACRSVIPPCSPSCRIFLLPSWHPIEHPLAPH